MSGLAWDIRLSANSIPLFQPFCILYDPNQIVVWVYSFPSPLSPFPLIIAVSILLYNPYQLWYFIRSLTSLALPFPVRASPSPIPSPLYHPDCAGMPYSRPHSPLSSPLLFCSHWYRVLCSALVPGHVASCKYYRGYYT